MMRRRDNERERGGVALGALAILVVAAVIGLVQNRFSGHPLPPFASEAALRPAVASGVSYIDLAGAKAMFDATSALFIDARPPEEYDAGHVPGAVNLPSDEFAKAYARLAPTIERARALVCYCEGLTCDRSSVVANLLAARGHSHVFILFSGWDQWQAAGYPSEGSSRQ